jgi:hypothetical protein
MGPAVPPPDPDTGCKMNIDSVSGHAGIMKGKVPGIRDYFTKRVSAL